MIGMLALPNNGAAQTGEIIQSILGRPLQSAQVSQAYIHADGSLEGVFNGISFAGTWTLEDGKYCRKFTRGLTGAPICMTVTAEYAPNGAVRAVIFAGPGGRARFVVGQ
ncbi:hypothetical protein [Aliiroseovarius sp. PrR006]|uniref:hypothetical protein n=1 Tax=Aliiroseovarius sp. PrR006 TaxID=2706883 RepID=UPI0013D6FBD7|nr:hypothetical protein [Aliiroseovarius sp. PrR006]NDW52544.1 hypothetical protein [Aliiroseovarius sp. PrR006]